MYGSPSPAAMAFAPMVLPVPAGPRNRKFRICMGRPVVFCACLQISTTSGGMIYHSGSFGIRLSSNALKVRPGVRGYLPTKSVCSTTTSAFLITAGPVLAKIVNSPAVTLVGTKDPESS